MVKALLIAVDGTETELEVNTLEDFQEAVGGYITTVGLPKYGCDMYINEEGHRLHIPCNVRATCVATAAEAGLHDKDFIVGPALVCGACDEEGKPTDITNKFPRSN